MPSLFSKKSLVDENSFIDVDVEPVKSEYKESSKQSDQNPFKDPIVICLPGKSFSGEFLQSYTNLITTFLQNNIPFVVSTIYNPNIYFCRNAILGGNVTNGKNQKPFNGKLKYSYLLWLDSDIIFTPQNIKDLITEAQKYDFVSGLYSLANGQNFATVEFFDNNYLKENGLFQFLTPEEVSKKKAPFPVAYTGLGFCMMKYGVIESLQYPWFKPKFIQVDDITELASEDTSLCINLSTKGILPYVCPNIIVGHQKTFIISPPENDERRRVQLDDGYTPRDDIFKDTVEDDNIHDFAS